MAKSKCSNCKSTILVYMRYFKKEKNAKLCNDCVPPCVICANVGLHKGNPLVFVDGGYLCSHCNNEDKENFTCKDCKTQVRKKSVKDYMVALRLCPQCYTKGSVPSRDQIKDALLNVLDGCKGPEEIHCNTGLDRPLCQEAYDIYIKLLEEK